MEERPRSSQEEEQFLEGEFGKNNIPIAIPLFSDEIFKKIPKEASAKEKDTSVRFGQFDVILPGVRQQNKIEDNIIKDYGDLDYQYDYKSDEELILNYDIGRLAVRSTTEVPIKKPGHKAESKESKRKETKSEDFTTSSNPQVAVTSERSSAQKQLEAPSTKSTPAKVSGSEESQTSKAEKKDLSANKKLPTIGRGATLVSGGEKEEPQIAQTETSLVATKGSHKVTAEEGEAEEKGAATDEKAPQTTIASDQKDESNKIDQDVEEVLEKSLARGEPTVITDLVTEASEVEPEKTTTAPFARFKPTTTSVSKPETDEKAGVTIPSVFRFLPTLSSGRRDRPSLRDRAKALRAITTLSKALRTSSSTTKATTEAPTTKASLPKTPTAKLPTKPTPLHQPPVESKHSDNDDDNQGSQDLKGGANASALLSDPSGAVWQTAGHANTNQHSLKPSANEPTDSDQLSSKPGQVTNPEELSKAQLQEKLRQLEEKLAKLATDAEVLTKKPTQSTTTQSPKTMSTTTTSISSSSLVTGPIRVAKVTTSPLATTLSNQQQPTLAPTTQVKVTTWSSGQEETKFPNFPKSGVQDDLRAAVEAGLRNLGSFVIWSDSPRVVPPPTRPSPVFRPSRKVAKVN